MGPKYSKNDVSISIMIVQCDWKQGTGAQKKQSAWGKFGKSAVFFWNWRQVFSFFVQKVIKAIYLWF